MNLQLSDIANGWRQIKALYFDGELRFSYPYLASRRGQSTGEGVDRLASRVTLDYLTAKGRGGLDERCM